MVVLDYKYTRATLERQSSHRSSNISKRNQKGRHLEKYVWRNRTHWLHPLQYHPQYHRHLGDQGDGNVYGRHHHKQRYFQPQPVGLHNRKRRRGTRSDQNGLEEIRSENLENRPDQQKDPEQVNEALEKLIHKALKDSAVKTKKNTTNSIYGEIPDCRRHFLRHGDDLWPNKVRWTGKERRSHVAAKKLSRYCNKWKINPRQSRPSLRPKKNTESRYLDPGRRPEHMLITKAKYLWVTINQRLGWNHHSSEANCTHWLAEEDSNSAIGNFSFSKIVQLVSFFEL